MSKRRSPARPPLHLIVSGGQTGADQGGLLGAREAGVRTGGTAPRGWRTEDGAAPWLADFGLEEADREAYPVRTRANIDAADGTVIFGLPLSDGSKLTTQYCAERTKPLLHLPYGEGEHDADEAARELADWLRRNGIGILNVAGNRESRNPGLADYTSRVVAAAIRLLRDEPAATG